MKLSELESFLVLVRTENMSQAAATLGLSQPRVSQMLQTLERKVGCPLFDRSNLGLQPTVAAFALVPYAEQMLQARTCGLAAARETCSMVGGTLHVGVNHTSSTFAVSQFIRVFHEAFPQMQLKLTGTLPSQLIDGLKEEEFDVCLCFQPPHFAPLVWTPLIKTDMVGIHAPSATHSVPDTLSDFAQLPLVLPSRSCSSRLLLDKELQKLGIYPKIVMEIDDASALISTVRDGIAVSIVPRLTIRPSHELQLTTLDRPRLFIQRGFLTRKNPAREVKAFMKLAQDYGVTRGWCAGADAQ